MEYIIVSVLHIISLAINTLNASSASYKTSKIDHRMGLFMYVKVKPQRYGETSEAKEMNEIHYGSCFMHHFSGYFCKRFLFLLKTIKNWSENAPFHVMSKWSYIDMEKHLRQERWMKIIVDVLYIISVAISLACPVPCYKNSIKNWWQNPVSYLILVLNIKPQKNQHDWRWVTCIMVTFSSTLFIWGQSAVISRRYRQEVFCLPRYLCYFEEGRYKTCLVCTL